MQSYLRVWQRYDSYVFLCILLYHHHPHLQLTSLKNDFSLYICTSRHNPASSRVLFSQPLFEHKGLIYYAGEEAPLGLLWTSVTKGNDTKIILIPLFLFAVLVHFDPWLFLISLKLFCPETFKCLACFTISITCCESMTQTWKLSNIFYFWLKVHTNKPPLDATFFFCLNLFSLRLFILSRFINHTGRLH